MEVIQFLTPTLLILLAGALLRNVGNLNVRVANIELSIAELTNVIKEELDYSQEFAEDDTEQDTEE